MSLEWMVASLLLAGILCLMRYVARVEGEFGRILSRDAQAHLDAWEQAVEPRLRMSRERMAIAANLWAGLAVALQAVLLARLIPIHLGVWTADAAVQWLVAILLVLALCAEVIPHLLLQRLPGDWLAPLAWLLRLLLLVMVPGVLVVSFLLSLASLTEPTIENSREDDAGDVEALLEVGEEEGILEEQDRQLVRSALEFGDKRVKEVMTPRSAIFAVPEEMLLKDFVEALSRENYSRVPVYRGTLDAVTGIAFAHDLLHVSDLEKAGRTVGSLQRPVALVPETKPGYELLREMQREKQHMRVVMDEYGEVAGLVTIEDLLEAIVGAIGDEHDKDADAAEEQAVEDGDGIWLVPGSFPADQLAGLLGGDFLPESEGYESQTVGGLVTEMADRIPLAGEVVLAAGLRMEIVEATERRVERVRVQRLEQERESARLPLHAEAEESGDAGGSEER